MFYFASENPFILGLQVSMHKSLVRMSDLVLDENGVGLGGCILISFKYEVGNHFGSSKSLPPQTYI